MLLPVTTAMTFLPAQRSRLTHPCGYCLLLCSGDHGGAAAAGVLAADPDRHVPHHQVSLVVDFLAQLGRG
jgi:hypothetical protein